MAGGGDWEGLAKKKGVSVEEAKKTWERRKTKDGKWIWVKTKEAVAATSGTSSSESHAESSSGAKFTLKGNPMYRNYGVGKK